METTTVRELFRNTEKFGGQVVQVKGWIRNNRNSNKFDFIDLNDGSFFKSVQVVYEEDSLDNYGEVARSYVGAALGVKGLLVLTPNAKQPFEIKAQEVWVEGTSTPDYPLQPKRHSMEYLREIAYLRPRTNMFSAVFRVRSLVAYAIHKFFQEQNFVYVHTPIITGSDAEGAGEMFRVTTIGFSQDYKTEDDYDAADFFGRRAGLSVSGQLEGEMAATAMGKIYTFGPSFRAENSNTPKHLAEFWHVEPEIAFAELDDVIEVAEDMVKHVIGTVLEKCPDEIAFFDAHFEKGLKARLEELISHEFGRVTYTEAIELLKKSGENFVYPVEWGCDLQTEHERYLSEKVFGKAVFVTDYPKEIKSFYMKQNPDGKTVAAVDLLVPGVGEIIGGSEREADYDKLIAAMKERNMNLDLYSDYLDLRKYGTVPHGGFGLGFERLIMYTTGVQNIRDVIMFPRTVGSII